MRADYILEGINSIRADNGLVPLSNNRQLERAAQERAASLCEIGELDHYGWLGSVAKYYDYAESGENLAYNYYDRDTLIGDWMSSPTHYSNIVDARFIDTGIAIKECDNSVYIVQEFGLPRTNTDNSFGWSWMFFALGVLTVILLIIRRR